MASQNRPEPIKEINPHPPSFIEYWKELGQYKSLILVFAYQEIKSMYAQTYFGWFWSILRPLITLTIFTIIFSNFLRIPTEQPYYLFAFAGMIAWNYFAQIVNNASTVIQEKQDLIRKMYFPKLILPITSVLVGGVDVLVSFIIILGMIFFHSNIIEWNIFLLPFFLLLNILCGLAISFWMSILSIRFRDLNHIIPSIISIAIWVTPVFYPTSIIPEKFKIFLYVNPMAGIIDGYRFALLGDTFPEWQYWIAISVASIAAIAGVFKLIQVEHNIVDYA